MVKGWVVRREDDFTKLAVVFASFRPKGAMALAPIDEITGEFESADWLQVEIFEGREIITINQPEKDRIQSERLAKEEQDLIEKEAKENQIKKARKFLKQLESSSLDAAKIKQALLLFSKVLLDHDRQLNKEVEDD